MSEAALVSLVALVGWLILVSGALRARQLGARKIVTLALTWVAIFVAVAWLIWAIRR